MVIQVVGSLSKFKRLDPSNAKGFCEMLILPEMRINFYEFEKTAAGLEFFDSTPQFSQWTHNNYKNVFSVTKVFYVELMVRTGTRSGLFEIPLMKYMK